MRSQPNDLLTARLLSHVLLSEPDTKALAALPGHLQTLANRNMTLGKKLSDGHVHMIVDGFACRYRDLNDGRRQILSLLLPGDIVDLRQFVLGGTDQAVLTLSPVTLLSVANASLFSLLESHPRITTALWSTTLAEESISREWLVSIGKRSAIERMAHLLCETYLRLEAVGRTEENRFPLPLTQSELADTLGLSTVHVNRTLQELRKSGQIAFQAGTVEIFDFAALAKLAMFAPGYLHQRERQKRDAIPA